MEKRAEPSFLNPRNPSIGFDRRYRPRPDRRINLDQLIKCEEIEDESHDQTASSTASTETMDRQIETVSVYLRIRPTNVKSNAIQTTGNVLKIKMDDINKEKHFSFTDIFDETVGQKKVYETTVETALNSSVIKSSSLSLLTYGTSGSGKTHTLMGSNGSLGVIPRAIHQIFSQWKKNISGEPHFKIINNKLTILDDVEAHHEKSVIKYYMDQYADVNTGLSDSINNNSIIDLDSSDNEYDDADYEDDGFVFCNVWISFVEIYNENLRDLLSTSKTAKKTLKIISNDRNAYVQDLTTVFVKSREEAFALLQYGQNLLHYGSTDVNSNSSRSHSVFIVGVATFTRLMHTEWITYKFCDLAGSERQKKTGNVGVRMKEAQRINSSLLVLGRCLDIIHQNQKKKKQQEIVPVRESKLTFLLQAALLGKEKLTMIVNLLPIDEYYEENLHVLNFSSIAKQIIIPEAALNKNRSTRYSLFLSKAISSPRSTDYENRFIAEETENLREKCMDLELELENAREELYNLRIDMCLQEQKVKNEVIELLNKQNLKRFEIYEKRIKHAQETSNLPYISQIKTKTAKIAEYEDYIDELEEENDSLKNKIESLTSEIRIIKKKSKSTNRRMSF